MVRQLFLGIGSSFSFLTRQPTRSVRAGLIVASTVVLAACGGAVDPSSSSSSKVSSSSSVAVVSSSSAISLSSSSSISSSSSSVVSKTGAQLFGEQCTVCHTEFTGGVSVGKSTAIPDIDTNNFNYDNKPNSNYLETEAGLALYIKDQMPPGSATLCGAECATAIANYMWSMRTGGGIPKTDYASFTTNVAAGKAIFEQSCLSSGCHSAEGRGENAINFIGYKSAADFHNYIEPAMPKKRADNGGPSDCVGQCSANVSSYLWSVRPIEVACTDEDGVLFAKRALPLLSPYQYKYAVQDIFSFIDSKAVVPEQYLSAPDANYVGAFPHTLRKQVGDSSATLLFNNALGIAEWNDLPGNRFVSCSSTSKTVCADEFVKGFAKMAFRRPLKTVAETGEMYSEVEYFNRIFADAPSVSDGIKWAIVGVLNSPQFLYRSELGVSVASALNNPLFTTTSGGGAGGSSNPADYEAVGTPVKVNGVSFTSKVADGGGNVGEVSPDASTTYKLYTNGSLKHSFNFTDPSLLTVRVRGNDYNGVWPRMDISVDGVLIDMQEVASPQYANDYKEFTYVITGVNKAAELVIHFGNDASASGATGAPKTDVDLHVAYAEVVAAKAKGGTAEVETSFVDQLNLVKNDTGAYVLDPYEFAAMLSFMITGSTPDPELMAAAATGGLNTQAGVAAHIDRMFETARAERHMKDFVSLWLQTQDMDKNKELKALDPNVDLRELMLTELQEFFWHIVNDEGVPYSDFFNADYTFLNKRLADHYGLTWNGSDQNTFTKTTIPADKKRGGIVTMGAFLASHAHNQQTSTIFRGVHVREDLLCQHIVPPGSIDEAPGVREEKLRLANAAKETGTLTTRRYFEIATLSDGPNSGCGICHYYDINPLGATMEDFDGFGRYRTQQIPEGGKAGDPLIDIIAASGLFLEDPILQVKVEGVRGLENFKDYSEESDPIYGARDLSLTLGQTDSVQSCFVEKAFRSILSRPIKNSSIDLINVSTDTALNEFEASSFACANEQLKQKFASSGQNPKALFKELGNLSLMRFRH